MVRRIAALIGSILGMSASSQAAQSDDSTSMFTPEETALQPEARVKAFIADFHRAHSLLGAETAAKQFERWRVLVQRLDQAHFADHAGRELSQVIHGTSPHTLVGEPIVSVKRKGERVIVETRTEEMSLAKFHEYELGEVSAGDWRIMRLREFLDPPDAPFMTEKERPRFENPRIHPLQRLSTEEADFDGNKIFVTGTTVRIDGRESSIEVRQIGMLDVSTGILVVGDLGYGPGVLSPVGLRVPLGRHRAEVAVAFERNAALRIRFSDREVVDWHPADMGDGGHGVGVDAGNIAVMDLGAIMTLKARDKERAFDAYARAGRRPNSAMLSLVRSDDTVVADSAWGDGRYPVYWGVDSDGKPVVLVVDFLLFPR